MSSADVDCLYIPFQFGFLFFFCLNAMQETSKTILNRSGQPAHSYIVPDLRGNTLSFSPLSMPLTVYDPFNALLNLFANILLIIFACKFLSDLTVVFTVFLSGFGPG